MHSAAYTWLKPFVPRARGRAVRTPTTEARRTNAEVRSAPLRVCDLVQFHSPISGGVKRFIEDKCRWFAHVPEVEHCVIVPGPEDGYERWGRSHIHTVKSPRLIGSVSYRVLYHVPRINGVLEAFRPDVIEVGDPYLTAWIGRGLAPGLKAKVVGFYHSDYPRAWYRTLERFAGQFAGRVFERGVTRYLRRLYRGMDAVVVASRMLENLWVGRGLPSVHRIPLGVDGDVFRPALDSARRTEVRRGWGLPPDAKALLFVGRIAREKRIEWLLSRFEAVKHQHPELHLVLIGDGEWRKRVELRAAAEPRIHWRPYIKSSAELARAYDAADAFVHAGLGETFGLSLLEAQSVGLTAIAPIDSGLDETLIPYGASALLPAEDPDAWTAALARLAKLPYDEAERAARHQRVQDEFSWWKTYARLRDLYSELCACGPDAR